MSWGRAARFVAVVGAASIGLVAIVSVGALAWRRFAPHSEPDASAPAPNSSLYGDAPLRSSDAAPPAPGALRSDALPLGRELAQASAERRAFALTLRDPDGASVAGARWAVFRGPEMLASGRTSADGRAAFDAVVPRELSDESTGGPAAGPAPPGSAVELVARHPKLSPLLATIERGSQAFAFEPRYSISGVCTVDGRAPAVPVELALRSSRAFWGSEHVPMEAWRAIGGRPAYAAPETTTDAEGRFAFDDLLAGYAGVINWNIYELDGLLVPVDGREPLVLVAVEVAAPRSDVLVELTSHPALVGRVLDALSDAPAMDVDVRLEWGGAWSRLGSASIDRDGRFRTVLERATGEIPDELDVVLISGDGIADSPVRVRVPEGPGDRDLGDFHVRPRRTTDVVVRDAEGAPIADAAVERWPAVDFGPSARYRSFHRTERRTDREGRATLAASFDATHVHVAALGFAAREVPLGPPGEPVHVTLERGAMLDLRVVGAEGELRVRLAGGEPPFLDRGAPAWRPERTGPDRLDAVFEMEDQRRLLLGDVRPGVPFSACAYGPTGTGIRTWDDEGAPCLAAADVAPLAAGEHRVVTLVAGAPQPELSGRVVDPAGAPIGGADVFAFDRKAPDATTLDRAKTDPDGRFFALFVPHARSLLVSADGFEDGHVPDVAPGAPLEIVLTPRRTVRVRVVGPGGEACPDARVEVALGFSRLRTAREEQPGVHILRGLPDRKVGVRAIAAGRTFERELGRGATELGIEVPAWGALEIGLARLAGSLTGDVFLRVQPADASLPATVRALAADARSARIDALAAGDYTAEVVRADAERAIVPLSGRAEVRVAAGATARVTLAPREE
jgi:5-hydroxyisourate hydrolase-like protein (transthyretin family)